MNENPVFLVGVFRSGTSLLSSLLNQNPGVALMYECDIWNFPRLLLGYRFRHNWVERIEFLNQALSRHRMISGNDLAELSEIRSAAEFYRRFGQIKGAAVSGEKSPFFCSRIEQLHRMYPGAAFILVWRNPLEVYRSVLKAGQTSRFFGRPGILSRLIYLQDQAIRQAQRIEKHGARVMRVDYADIVDQTENVCRDICGFLGVPFDARMLELNKADLSAVYTAPHHAFLRRGIIERQIYTEDLVPPVIAKKLERYRHRWEHLQADWLHLPITAATTQAGPGPLESGYHNVLGRALTFYDSLKRAGFEFMPLPWLRVYRLLKNWVVNPPSNDPDVKTSLFKDFREHRLTILTAAVALGVVAFIHLHANPHLQFILFYWIPCALLALVVNNRWATLFVLICAILSPLIQFDGDMDYRSTGVFVWNFITRFLVLEIMVVTLGRIRKEFKEADEKVN
jgi:hypothetical protein